MSKYIGPVAGTNLTEKELEAAADRILTAGVPIGKAPKAKAPKAKAPKAPKTQLAELVTTVAALAETVSKLRNPEPTYRNRGSLDDPEHADVPVDDNVPAADRRHTAPLPDNRPVGDPRAARAPTHNAIAYVGGQRRLLGVAWDNGDRGFAVRLEAAPPKRTIAADGRGVVDIWEFQLFPRTRD